MKRLPVTLLSYLVVGLTTGAATAVGCSGDEGTTPGGDATSGAGTSNTGASTGGAGTGGAGLDVDGGASDAPLDPDSACATQSAEATLQKRPVDVIFVIDNSGSMTQEIISVQNNINANFATIIAASGVDYRVILISEHGEADPEESVCISAPLSTTECNPVPDAPGNNPPVFFHYSVQVSSHNSLCRILDTYAGGIADRYDLAPNGWQEWLRPEAFKVFVEMTDDGADCSTTSLSPDITMDDDDDEAGGLGVSEDFDTALLALSPEQFGDAAQRNYMFYSIVGLEENTPATEPWQPTAPMVLQRCGTAVAPGTAYQSLSLLTGGLRFPLCEFESYDSVFQAIAAGVISGATVQCEFPIPDAPAGQTIDLATVQVSYSPSTGGAPVTFAQVPGAAACAQGTFFIEEGTIKLCPDTCAAVQQDSAAKLEVLYGCEVTPR